MIIFRNIFQKDKIEFLRRYVMEKEYFIIQNKEGKFLVIDSMSGGYPCFVDDFIEGRIFKNIEDARNILYGGYGEMFQKDCS